MPLETTDPGIAFNETVVWASSHDRHWVFSHLGKRPDSDLDPGQDQDGCEHRPRSKGPRPFIDMLIDVIADNIQSITGDDLAEIPTHLLWKLYKKLHPRRGLTFHAWKIFSKLVLAGRLESLDTDELPIELYRHRVEIQHPSLELSCYTGPLDCLTVDHLSCLTIDSVQTIRSDELITLAKMTNLAILDIREDITSPWENKMTDNVVRGWTEIPNPFPHLKYLQISNAAISSRSIQYLSTFPSLLRYDVYGKFLLRKSFYEDGERLAKENGWQEVVDSEPGDWTQSFWSFKTSRDTDNNEETELVSPSVEEDATNYSLPQMPVAHLHLNGLGARSSPYWNRNLHHLALRRIPPSLHSKPPVTKKREAASNQTSLKRGKKQKLKDIFSGFNG